MDKKVSIIVPVYNVEKYIEECVQSLLGQSYQNLEIILVDDASPDNCGAICDAYAEKDSRVKVIHKPNGGAASARNAGLDAATGDYICFVDSDDVIRADYVQILLAAAEEKDATIAVCDLCYWKKTETQIVHCEKEGCYSAKEYLLEFTKSWSCSLMTNKLFKREAIGAIRFEEGHYIDDEFFTYLVVINSDIIVVKSAPLYYYRMRKTSVMQNLLSHQQKVMLDRIEYNVTRYTNVSVKMPQLDEAFFVFTLDTLARYWHHSKDMPIAQQQLRTWINDHLGRLIRAKLPLKQKLIYLRAFYLKKPAIMAEPNPIQMDADAYFD